MAYVLGGGNNEADGFTTAIANFALRAMHESTGLVDYTTVVAPNQGNQYLVPQFAPITYQDYNPNTGAANAGFGNAPAAFEQNPALGQGSITATPAVAATAFDIFYAWTTSFELAATLGAELGESYGEKVDIRVCQAFLSFKATPTNSNYSPTPADGFARPTELGAMELMQSGLPSNTAGWTTGFTSASVLELIRNVKQNYKVARLPGAPIIVLDSNGDSYPGSVPGQDGSSMNRLLAELTGGAVNNPTYGGGSQVSALGNELLATGRLDNVYGCKVAFTTFLPSATRPLLGQGSNSNVLVGAYFHETALITVLKEGLQIKMGEKPGGLQMWLTGVAYMGSGVADPRRGGAINIIQA
jgi:hypothetical protein